MGRKMRMGSNRVLMGLIYYGEEWTGGSECFDLTSCTHCEWSVLPLREFVR